MTLTVRAIDDLSGVERVDGSFDMPHSSLDYGFAMSRVDGTAPDGVWRYQVNLPRHAASGEWPLKSLHLKDQAGNATHYPERSAIEALGFPQTSFTQAGPGDTSPPEIRNLSIDPQVVQTGNVIRFDVHVTDDLSGIAFTNCLWIVYRSEDEPSFEGIATTPVRVAGDDLDAVLRSAKIITGDAPRGGYVVTSISACDRALNKTTLSGSELDEKGWTLTFEHRP